MDKLSDAFDDCNMEDDCSFVFQISRESTADEALASIYELKEFIEKACDKLSEKFGVSLTGFAFPLAFKSNENQQLVGILTCRHLFYDYRRDPTKDEQDPTMEFKFFKVNDGFPEKIAFGQTLSTKVVSARKEKEIIFEGEKKFQDYGLDYVLLPIPHSLHPEINFCDISSFDQIKAMTLKTQSAETNLQIPCGLSMLQKNLPGEEKKKKKYIPTHAAGFLVKRNNTEKSLEHDIKGIPGMSGTPIFSRNVEANGPADVRLVGIIDHRNGSEKSGFQYYGKYICGIIEDIKKKITAIKKTDGENTVIEQFVFKSGTKSTGRSVYQSSEDVSSYPLWVVGTPCKSIPKLPATSKVEELEEENLRLKKMLEEKENKIKKDEKEISHLNSKLEETQKCLEKTQHLVPEENKKDLPKMPEDVSPETVVLRYCFPETVVCPNLDHSEEGVPIPEPMSNPGNPS